MAEVLAYWPPTRKPAAATFNYPWKQWMDLDENGVGDIWLAELGVDWPADSNVANFRSIIYTRTGKINRRRLRDAPLVLQKVGDTVKKVPQYTPLRVKIRSVSDTQLAFQFYEGDEPPEPPVPIKSAVPTRRTPLRQRKAGSILQKTGAVS